MCAPSPPPAPDYAGAAAAQGEANKEAALAGSRLNNPNVVSPYGTQTFTEGATPDARPTVTQTFSPQQQALFDLQNSVKEALGKLGVQGATSLQGVVGTPFDLSGAPPAPGSASETRDKVYNAMMQRVNEDYGNTRDQRNSDLIAAGIRPGSKAYDDAMFALDRSRNDAMTQAQLASGQEASRDFGMDTEARRNAIAEILAKRQTPLNEIASLMSGSQVTNPFAVPNVAQNSQVAAAPVYQATSDAGNYASDLYNAKAGMWGNTLGGLMQLGGTLGAAAISDRRLKSNIRRIGTHPLGIGWYEYDIGGERQQGVMADEVLGVRPNAVLRRADGFLMVDYGALT